MRARRAGGGAAARRRGGAAARRRGGSAARRETRYCIYCGGPAAALGVQYVEARGATSECLERVQRAGGRALPARGARYERHAKTIIWCPTDETRRFGNTCGVPRRLRRRCSAAVLLLGSGAIYCAASLLPTQELKTCMPGPSLFQASEGQQRCRATKRAKTHTHTHTLRHPPPPALFALPRARLERRSRSRRGPRPAGQSRQRNSLTDQKAFNKFRRHLVGSTQCAAP